MSFRPNTRRVYTSWARAADHAKTRGGQTGWKHRVFKPWAKHVGEVRLTVVYDVSIMFPMLDQDEAVARLRTALEGSGGASR